jgi:stage V sporulation protein D (sporulation-specific penicillin-binding protein)
MFIGIVVRLLYLQVVTAHEFRIAADNQHYVELSLPAERGNIEDSSGNPYVINEPTYLVYAEPHNVKDPLAFLRDVPPLLAMDTASVSASFGDGTRVWLPLQHKVPSETANKLMALKIAGLGFEKESKRFYPEASTAAHILGFVGMDENGNDKGYFGLEGFYDRELRGKDGMLRREKDVHGNPIVVGEAMRMDAQNGRTLVLWTDRVVQRIAEQKLIEGVRKYGAKEGTVTIMDPKTGGVLAMATFPSYDPASYANTDKELYKNPIVASSYEPGSTFKTLIMSAGLEEKVITPETKMDETGPVRIGEYLIRTWNDQYRGSITMTDVLIHSSNVGMVFVERKLGEKKMLTYIHNYGFGKPTNIDLEEESSPQLRADSEWGEIDLATGSFGQGIAVTPIQMVRAVAALANNGWLMEPHIVREIRDSNGKIIPIKPKKIRQVVSEKTAELMKEMMILAVDNGEAKWAKPKGYQIAGKTGTAQIAVSGHYDDKKTIASFVGFAPADNPKFVMLVTLHEPSSSQWGSETAAPLFFSIAKDLFMYYGIAPQ